jgi:hypothetical protein
MNTYDKVRCWLSQHGSTAQFEITDFGDGRGGVITKWESTAEQPALADLPDDAAVAAYLAQVAADAKAQAATIDNADVRLRAAVIELCAEIEKIKTVIRTAHPAAGTAIPARTAAEWGAAIKAKAQELQQ